ncbi:hypothetical protein K7432_012924, partial [Basidiobolus ranarum]
MPTKEHIEDVPNHNNTDLAISVNNEKALSVGVDDANIDKVGDKKKSTKKTDAKELGPKVSYFKLYRFANSWDIT